MSRNTGLNLTSNIMDFVTLEMIIWRVFGWYIFGVDFWWLFWRFCWKFLKHLNFISITYLLKKQNGKCSFRFNWVSPVNLLDHGLRTPNESKNQINLKNWADVADKISFGRKVQLFWEDHKNLHNLPHGFDVLLSKCQNHEEEMRQFLWPSQKSWTLPKNLGVGVNFRPCSEGYFPSERP